MVKYLPFSAGSKRGITCLWIHASYGVLFLNLTLSNRKKEAYIAFLVCAEAMINIVEQNLKTTI